MPIHVKCRKCKKEIAIHTHAIFVFKIITYLLVGVIVLGPVFIDDKLIERITIITSAATVYILCPLALKFLLLRVINRKKRQDPDISIEQEAHIE